MNESGASTDSESYFSAGEEPSDSDTRTEGADGVATAATEKVGLSHEEPLVSRSTLDQKTRLTSPPVVTAECLDESKDDVPVPPPRRRKRDKMLQRISAEAPAALLLETTHNVEEGERRRINTFSWPRPSKQGSGKTRADEGLKETQRSYQSEVEMPCEEERSDTVTPTLQHPQPSSPRSGAAHKKSPSISIEPESNLELSLDLTVSQLAVETNDTLTARASGSNDTREGVIVHSDDESLDGDVLLMERNKESTLEEGMSEGLKDEEEADEKAGATAHQRPKQQSLEFSDSREMLEQFMVKNLDTGEQFPLSAAEERIPQGINPIDSHCQERSKGQFVDDEPDMDQDPGDPSQRRKTHGRTKLLQRLLKKGREKRLKGEGRHFDTSSGSDEEATPEHDQNSVKYKCAYHNRGSLDFEKVRVKQELVHEHLGAVWVTEFSICGRLLATAGQDSVVRVWVLRTAHHFFHELQQKYARMGIHSSADSLSERSSVTSSHSSDPDEDPANAKPFVDHPLCSYMGHSADVLDLSWSKNFFLLSSSMDKTVRLWHISRKECLCCFQHVDFVTAIAFHPRDDRYFLSGSLDGKMRLWNIPDKKVALWNEIEGVGSHLITAANFCMNGKLAVAGTYDGRCIFYETEHLKYHTQIHVRSRHGKNRGRKISGIEPLPGEDKILVTSNDSRLRLYNLRDHSLSCKYKGYHNSTSQIRATFSRDGQYILCGSEDNYIYVWKTYHDYGKLSSARRDRNDCYESFTAHTVPITAVVFAPVPGITVDEGIRDVGEVVVAGDYRGHIKVYVNSDDL